MSLLLACLIVAAYLVVPPLFVFKLAAGENRHGCLYAVVVYVFWIAGILYIMARQ